MCAFEAILATREEIDAALDDKRPFHKCPDLPHCYVSDLKASGSYREAMRSEHAHVCEDSTGREFYELLDAGTFDPLSGYTAGRQMITGLSLIHI